MVKEIFEFKVNFIIVDAHPDNYNKMESVGIREKILNFIINNQDQDLSQIKYFKIPESKVRDQIDANNLKNKKEIITLLFEQKEKLEMAKKSLENANLVPVDSITIQRDDANLVTVDSITIQRDDEYLSHKEEFELRSKARDCKIVNTSLSVTGLKREEDKALFKLENLTWHNEKTIVRGNLIGNTRSKFSAEIQAFCARKEFYRKEISDLNSSINKLKLKIQKKEKELDENRRKIFQFSKFSNEGVIEILESDYLDYEIAIKKLEQN
eukprot:TRINITY_DN2156_c0_g1_i4.p1 TRINITY_DN2156_c0_g1~~TRINITY_DN2156_c0_g1_i4.p1  ORF type:complete len:268 (-),score=71.61 TRINITY_DN2156_c0_g1_i4:36-839(-)